jgi:predicted metal-dependent hydrolase
MISRKPKFAVDAAPLIWSRIPEFAQYWNGASFTAPHIEPHLNSLMQQCQKRLNGRDPALHTEIDMFVRQESNHYRMHMRFNERMYAFGYASIAALEAKFKAELAEFMQRRSLEFNVAYCAGFENFTMYTAKYAYEVASDLFEGADPRGADLFLWHLAEEFEHRVVCHKAFAAISGNYFVRIYGLLYAFVHFGGWTKKFVAAVMEHYRRDMTPEARKASIRRERQLTWRMNRYALPRLLAIFKPYYDPHKYQPPAQLQAALERYTAALGPPPA